MAKKYSETELNMRKEIYKPKEYCGLFGIYGNKEASTLTYLGLYALQHRGEEACGIITSDRVEFRLRPVTWPVQSLQSTLHKCVREDRK